MALIEGCKHSLEITVPVADVEKETERVAADIQKKVRLPGFRPGKAPMTIVKSKFGSDIRQDVLEAIVPRFFHEAAAKEGLQVVGRPNVVDVHFHDNEPIRFKAEFEVAPIFELADYRGVTITYAEPEVTDADVDERIEGVRDQKAEYVNEDPRPLVDGDYAVVSLESISGVAEKVSQDELMLKIGDEATLPAFSENLRGATPGDVKEFDISYPADYDRATLAGRTVAFRAELKAVRRKELPELNDEFAKDLGDFQTLDEFKETVRKTIFREREYQAQEAAKHQILDKLVDANDFPIPEAYLDRQIEMNVENQLRQLAGQGMDPSKLKLDWAKLKESQSERAKRDVRASLILDKISETESIGATQEEVDAEVTKIARQQRETVPLVRAKLQKDGGIARIAGHIRTDKTLRLLFEQARKEAPVKA
ncbi:MAG: trigger factor [Acidobacteriota bacterium]